MAESPPFPECPRCGYDLSGQVAAWPPGQCDLEGTCSECGLRVAWRDLLNERYFRLQGHIEHASRNHVRAFVRTAMMWFLPWRTWSWLKMSHRIEWKRVRVFVYVFSLLLYALLAPALGAAQVWTAPPWAGSVPSEVYFWPYVQSGRWWPTSTVRLPPVSVFIGSLFLVAAPFCFLLLPTTLRRAKVRRSHLARIAAYSMPLVAIMLFIPIVFGVLSNLPSIWGLPSFGQYQTRWFVGRGTLVVAWLMVLAWWWPATRSYLRLPHAFAVAFLLSTLSVLVAGMVMLIGALVWPPLSHIIGNELFAFGTSTGPRVVICLRCARA